MSTETRRIQFDFTARDSGASRTMDQLGRDAEDLEDRFDGLGQGMVDSGAKGAAGLTASFGGIAAAGAKMTGGLAAGITALPLIAQGAATGMALGMGAGLAGMGLMVAAKSKDVQREFSDMGKRVSGKLQEMAEPFEATLIAISGFAEDTFNSLAPHLERAFEKMAPAVTDFADIFARGLEGLGPVIDDVTDAFLPLLDELGKEMPALMKAVGDGISRIVKAAEPKTISLMVKAIGGLVTVASKAVAELAKLGGVMVRAIDSARSAPKVREAFAKLAEVVRTKVVPAAKELWHWYSTKILPVAVKLHKEVLQEGVKQFQKISKEIGRNSADWKEFGRNVAKVVEVVYKHLGPVLGWLGKTVLKGLGVWISLSIKSYLLLARHFNGLVETIRKGAPEIARWWKNIAAGAAKMKDLTIAGIRTMVRIFLDGVSKIVTGAAKAFGWVPGLGGKLRAAAKKVAEFKDDVNRSLAGVSKGRTATVTVKGIYGGGIGRRIPGLAKGGPVPAMWSGATEAYDSQPALLRVNEHVWTPEEVRSAGGHGQVVKLRQMAKQGLLQGLAGGGPVGFGITAQTTPKSVMNSTIWGPISRSITDVLMAMAKKLQKILKEMSGAGGVVAAARKMIGYPYSWGGGGKGGPSYGIGRGAGTFGFDCSGLTEYAWWKGAKKSIGGTTYEQWPNSVPSARRPGALGFPHMGHVVLDAGGGKIIQAPYTGSHVQEVPGGSGYSWRMPKGARFATGGPVRKLGMDFVGGFAQRGEAEMARLAGIAGSRAAGGPVNRGMPYIINDGGGPEVFVPRQSGQIHRAGSTVVVQHITAHINVPPTANLAEVGRAVNTALTEYKRKGGKVVTGSG